MKKVDDIEDAGQGGEVAPTPAVDTGTPPAAPVAEDDDSNWNKIFIIAFVVIVIGILVAVL